MRKHVVVIGGGITGLAAAYRLQRTARTQGLPLDITLYEAEGRLGGKLHTIRDGEFVIEAGPDSFLASKPQALALCAELGLGERLIGTNVAQRRTFIYSRGRLHDLPEGFSGLVPGRVGPLMRSALVSPLGKARLLLDLVLPPRPPDGDEPVATFMRRRLGREAFDRLIEPLMSGIYAGDAERLSLAATFPQLREMELAHGGLLRGVTGQKTNSLTRKRKGGTRNFGKFTAAGDAKKNEVGNPATGQILGGSASLNTAPQLGRGRRFAEEGNEGEGSVRAALAPPKWTGFVSLRGGMGQMVEVLERQLDCAVRTGCAVESIARSEGGWVVRAAGETVEADAIIVATPAYATAALLEPLDVHLAELLRAIPHGSTATVSLAFRQAEPRAGSANGPRTSGSDAGHGNTVGAAGTAIDAPIGFGFVVPSIERRPLLACTFVSNKFAGRAPAGVALIRCFIGRVGSEQLLAQDDAALVALARSELKVILGIVAEPLWARVFRWERGMPQYNLGHLARVEQIEDLLAAQPGLFTAGAAYRGVGIPDCIRSGEEAAKRAMQFLFHSCTS